MNPLMFNLSTGFIYKLSLLKYPPHFTEKSAMISEYILIIVDAIVLGLWRFRALFFAFSERVLANEGYL